MGTLGVIADDLTGGTTVAALLAGIGVDNVVALDDSVMKSSHEAVVVSTDSRALDPEEARHRVASTVRTMINAGFSMFSKRTDTTMRGGIGYEIEAMLSELSEDYMAVIVPAMPQSKRIVVGGYSLIDSTLLSRTQVAKDVRTPVHESYIPALLGQQMKLPLASITIGTILQGHDALKREFHNVRGRHIRAVVVDSTSLEDIDLIADTVAECGWPVLCVDPGPMTAAYARARKIRRSTPAPQLPLRLKSRADDKGIVVVVAGSATSTTHEQLAELLKVPDTVVLSVQVQPLVTGSSDYENECRRVLAACETMLEQRDTPPRTLVVALESTLTGVLIDMDRAETAAGLAPGEGATNVAKYLGAIGTAVMKKVGKDLCGVYVTGGDVMINTVRAMRASGISLKGYVIPQSDLGRLVGGPFADVPIVGKGGLTGGRDTAVHIVNRLFDERKIK
jgi:uncharacterized protein YgbK (DUF1537 family)